MHFGGTKMYLTWNQLPNPPFFPCSAPLPAGLSHTEKCWTAARQRKRTEGGSQMQKWWMLPPLESQPERFKLCCLPLGGRNVLQGLSSSLPYLVAEEEQNPCESRRGISVPMGKSNSSEMQDLRAAALHWRAPLVKMPGINGGHHEILHSAAKEVWLCV